MKHNPSAGFRPGARTLFWSFLAFSVSMGFCATSEAAPKTKYIKHPPKCDPGSSSSGGHWITETECITTNGIAGGQGFKLQAGVEYLAATGEPTATITDGDGRPIFAGGAVLTLVAAAEIGDKARVRHGLLTPAHTWKGFTSSVTLPTSDGDSKRTFIVTYTWPGRIEGSGADFFRDNNDELNGYTVEEAFETLPGPPIPALSGWGLILAALLVVAGGSIHILRPAAFAAPRPARN